MTDIVDTIDALIDEQLDAGEPIGGYDYDDPDYPSCWHCGRDWHGMRITTRIEQMRWRGAVDEDYRYNEDDSEVVCPGPDFIGPWADHYQLQRIRAVWQIPNDPLAPSSWQIATENWTYNQVRNHHGPPMRYHEHFATADFAWPAIDTSEVMTRWVAALDRMAQALVRMTEWPNPFLSDSLRSWDSGDGLFRDEWSTPLVDRDFAPDVDAPAGGAAARLAKQPSAITGPVTGATVPTTVDPPTEGLTTPESAARRIRLPDRQVPPMWAVNPGHTRRTRNGARDVRTPLA